MGASCICSAAALLKPLLVAEDAAAVVGLAIGRLALLVALAPTRPVGAVVIELVIILHALRRKALFELVRGGAAVAITGEKARVFGEGRVAGAGGEKNGAGGAGCKF